MNNSQYNSMSDAELKRFFRQHPEDKEALQAYLDRWSQRPKQVITKLGDPDFDEKIQAAIRQQIEAGQRDRLQDA
jgi:predicted metal-dependent RNase